MLAYFTAYKTAAELAVWTDLTTGEQELAARVGVQYVDASNHGLWKGWRSNETQALDWPRTGVEDADGYIILPTAMPTRLKQAHAEATFRVANGDTLIADESAGANIKSESKSLGPLSKAVVYDGTKSTSKSYPVIDRLIADLIDGSPTGFGARHLERA